jgi:hypothetical protein
MLSYRRARNNINSALDNRERPRVIELGAKLPKKWREIEYYNSNTAVEIH